MPQPLRMYLELNGGIQQFMGIVLYEGKLHTIVADYGNGQIEIREVNGYKEHLVFKDKTQTVPQEGAKE